MTTLVTGGAGFIGSELVRHLVNNGEKVLVLDDFSGAYKNNLLAPLKSDSLEIIRGSILDQKLVIFTTNK